MLQFSILSSTATLCLWQKRAIGGCGARGSHILHLTPRALQMRAIRGSDALFAMQPLNRSPAMRMNIDRNQLSPDTAPTNTVQQHYQLLL